MKCCVLVVLLFLHGSCSDRSSKQQNDMPTVEPTGRDKDVRDSLVLDAALVKANKELAAMEAAEPRDEDAIAKKKRAIKAVTETLERLRKRLDASPAQRPN